MGEFVALATTKNEIRKGIILPVSIEMVNVDFFFLPTNYAHSEMTFSRHSSVSSITVNERRVFSSVFFNFRRSVANYRAKFSSNSFPVLCIGRCVPKLFAAIQAVHKSVFSSRHYIANVRTKFCCVFSFVFDFKRFFASIASFIDQLVLPEKRSIITHGRI